ncbi:MAG: penicillin-binding protein 2 [Gammaproteobacteria bacterium]|nr:penicillin-binding protein 2 [Gammaproteobacteria bacterium]MBU2478774.1 penicillin-binding protein 2 [Gammaproteobacteria bacterium]
MKSRGGMSEYVVRRRIVLGLFATAFVALVWRAVDLQVFNQDFLQNQGDARHLRVVTLAAHRGMILDRNGEPLAVSTPVDSVWANPQELATGREYWSALAKILQLDPDQMRRQLEARSEREFVYLKRHVDPTVAAQIRSLGAPGVALQREYRRYYPDGEVTAQVLGFTDVDDVGQEGLELAYEDWMRGESGAKRVIKDGKHSIIENVESIRPARPGRDLTLSIDRRIQYLAYRELKAAVQQHKARSGSVVVLDTTTGEILAMVNQPSYNPNNRSHLKPSQIRNRAVTDLFEPGSTLKAFTVACGLESGKYRPETQIDTTPGFYRVGSNLVRDVHNYGPLDVVGVIRKSSNVGSSKIALSLDKEMFWNKLHQLGFGTVSASGFPGEASGLLVNYRRWRIFEQATLSFGYGMSATPLQLAQAYGVLAADGEMRPASFLKLDKAPRGERVFSQRTAREMRLMLEEAVGPDGTAPAARVSGYRVGGKTGTVRKSIAGGYADNRYVSVFAGFAPSSKSRLAIAVMIDEPSNGDYYGGKVAAPVFSAVMAGALRFLNVAPDALEKPDVPTAQHVALGGQL